MIKVSIAKKESGAALQVRVVTPADLKGKPKWNGMSPHLTELVMGKFRNEGFKAEAGKKVQVSIPAENNFLNLLFVGAAGKSKGRYEQLEGYRRLGAAIFEEAKRLQAPEVDLYDANLDLADRFKQLALFEGIGLVGYQFDRYLSSKSGSFAGVAGVHIVSGKKLRVTCIEECEALVAATKLARDLINTPSADCTPAFLAAESRRIAKEGKLTVKVWEQPELFKMGTNALLAVARGSSQPPCLIKIGYRPPGKARKTIALVGKGITFDSGGLSIKPAKSMEDMKCDMAGAAAVIAVMKAASLLKPKVAINAYIPACENVINGQATKPGDIVKGLSGKTIEILNTDAEGRLILSDAITAALRDECDALIDVATLTGACVVALGTDYAGVFSNNERLWNGIESAAAIEGERVWRLPLADEYEELVKSKIADIKNTGGQWGGAITGALFLKNFVGDKPWAHLDIAGPAFSDKERGCAKIGGVGFSVRTLLRLLLAER